MQMIRDAIQEVQTNEEVQAKFREEENAQRVNGALADARAMVHSEYEVKALLEKPNKTRSDRRALMQAATSHQRRRDKSKKKLEKQFKMYSR